MKIFNVILNGDDAKYFCEQDEEFKIFWIRKHTNQQDINIIKEFLANPPKSNGEDCGCGKKKKIALSDLTKPIEKEISTDLDVTPEPEVKQKLRQKRKIRKKS